MSWLLIKELVGASAETKPVPSQTCPPGPFGQPLQFEGAEQGPRSMGGPCGWSGSWRWVLSVSLGPLHPGCETLDLFLPVAQLQCSGGIRTPFVPRNTNFFSLVSGICSPHGENIFKDLGTEWEQ